MMTEKGASSLRVAIVGATFGTALVTTSTLAILSRGNEFVFRSSFLVLGWTTILIVWLTIGIRFGKTLRKPRRHTAHAR